MGTHCIIGIDEKKQIGFYKHYDGYPLETLPVILLYIGLFGYKEFKNEWKRIYNGGGCSVFYNLISDYDEKNWFEILKTKQLTGNLLNEPVTDYDIKSENYGYIVLPHKISIYGEGKLKEVLFYEASDFNKYAFIEGVFYEKGISKYILYKLQNKVS